MINIDIIKDALQTKDYTVQMLKGGKQGIVGLMTISSIKDDLYNKCVFKISKTITHTSVHEDRILKSLDKVSSICPFFLKSYGVLDVVMNEDYENCENPFTVQKGAKICVDVCFMEYINDSRKYISFIKHDPVPAEVISSLMQQTIMGIILAQKMANFSHYDLHSENILIQKCNQDLVFLYHSNETGRTFLTPTYGYYPRIIDYGFSYSEEGTKDITTPLDFMDSGYTSSIYDDIVDFRVFLISLQDDVKTYREDSELANTFEKFNRKLFDKVDVDWESGWFENNVGAATDFLTEELEDIAEKSETFERNLNHAIDHLQYIIELPVESKMIDNDKSDIITSARIAFKALVCQFIKFEKDLSSPFMGLYYFREMCIAAKMFAKEFKVLKTKDDAVRNFKNEFFSRMKQTKKFYNPKCNWEKLLTSLFALAECFEALLAKELRYRINFINKQYKKMPITDPEDIFYVIQKYFNVDYEINTNTNFIVFNETDGKSERFTLNEGELFETPDDIYKLYKEKRVNYKKNIISKNRSLGVEDVSSSEDDSDEEEYDWDAKISSDEEEGEHVAIDLDEF